MPQVSQFMRGKNMNEVKTDVIFFKDDLGKNLYKKKTYYTLEVEQEVLAKDKDEADKLFSDNGGLNYSEITSSITDTNNGVETSYVDANYQESGDTEYVGKVAYDEDNEYAEEDGDVIIDSYAEENQTEKALNDYVKEKAESDIDIAINLENERAIGK
tara:strand:+ start:21 stop:494 length:474 start_codon:yes stop_codon:yes gene_type:complete